MVWEHNLVKVLWMRMRLEYPWEFEVGVHSLKFGWFLEEVNLLEVWQASHCPSLSGMQDLGTA